jgi:hypothetical protein
MGTQSQDVEKQNQPGKPSTQNPAQPNDRPAPRSGQDKGKDAEQGGQMGKGKGQGARQRAFSSRLTPYEITEGSISAPRFFDFQSKPWRTWLLPKAVRKQPEARRLCGRWGSYQCLGRLPLTPPPVGFVLARSVPASCRLDFPPGAGDGPSLRYDSMALDLMPRR